jgi:hypothetical protein
MTRALLTETMFMVHQRLLNIALFPYFYGRLGDDPDAYVDWFKYWQVLISYHLINFLIVSLKI